MANPAIGAVEHAAARIRDMVAAGQLVPGQRLVEPDLAAQLSISRASLREAFRALESEGLVRLERYKGASVRRVERTELMELFEIRELLEGLAARRAAPLLARAPYRAELAAMLGEMEKAAKSRDGAQSYTRLNGEFHDLILQAAGSEQLSLLASHIRPPAVVRIVHHKLMEHDSVERSMAEHRAIFKALLDGDGERAETAMRRHIRSSMRSVPVIVGV